VLLSLGALTVFKSYDVGDDGTVSMAT